MILLLLAFAPFALSGVVVALVLALEVMARALARMLGAFELAF